MSDLSDLVNFASTLSKSAYIINNTYTTTTGRQKSDYLTLDQFETYAHEMRTRFDEALKYQLQSENKSEKEIDEIMDKMRPIINTALFGFIRHHAEEFNLRDGI